MPKDMRKLMEQAQKMQAQLQQTQSALNDQEFEGTAGGGVVKATVKGDGSVVAVDIDPSVIDPEDPSNSWSLSADCVCSSCACIFCACSMSLRMSFGIRPMASA